MASRRGSTLVLVVGALAFLAVLIAAYLSLGQRDRRSSATSVDIDRSEENIRGIRDHIAGVIADDVASVYAPQAFDFTRNGVVVREAFDYPYMSPFKVSDPSLATGSPAKGTAEWAQVRFNPSGSLPGEWAANTSILAFEASDPFLASSEPTWLVITSEVPVEQHLNNATDWASLSNIASDGRYVNLFNIREHFDAPSGQSPSQPPPTQAGRLSDNLWQYDINGALTQNRYDGTPADRNVPAHWGSRQQRLYRPATGALFGLANYHDSRYAPYMYADADGDGFWDSRFQELVDTSDPLNVRSLLPAESRHRWFVATRVVDLSGRVNVNTATEFWQAPTDRHRMGATPGDIDLMRLLTLNDPAARFMGVGSGEFSYNRLYMGAVLTKGNDYTQWTGTGAVGQPGFMAGANAFAAIRQTITSVLPVEQVNFLPFAPTTAQARANSYRTVGMIGPGRPDSLGGDLQYTYSGAFDATDLFEILRFHGVNDDTLLSRLEQATAGRIGSVAQEQLSPLRSSRSRDVELDYITSPTTGYDPATGLVRPTTFAGSPLYQAVTDVRRHLTTMSWARPLRSESIPLSLATGQPDQAYNVSAIGQVGFGARETRVNVRAMLETVSGATGSQPALDELFAVYGDALVPAASDPSTWDASGSPTLQSRSYGANAVLALRMAAHMTLNLIDSFDEKVTNGASENEVRAATLLLDPAQRTTVDGNPTAYPWWQASQNARLDFTDAKLPPDPTATGGALPPALNVFGMEAFPVLTQAAAFNVYTDTPAMRGGDTDWDMVPPGGPNEPAPVPITINGRIPFTGVGEPQPNPDFLMQVVAFQLNNPFDRPIRLADDTGAFYYIEFGGQRYELIEHGGSASGNLELDPRETRVFYAMSQSHAEIDARFTNADNSVVAGVAQDFIDRQLTVHQFDSNREPIWVLARSSTSGTAQVLTTVHDLLAGDPSVNNPTEYGKNRVVHLWRKLFVAGETHSSNNVANDLLIDRMRDPADPLSNRPTLDQRLPSTNIDVQGTEGFDESSSDPGDNTGYSITMWGSIRRPDTPLSTTSGVREPEPRGAIPAWCVERRADPSAGTPSFNHDEEDAASRSSIKKSDFATSGGEPTGATAGYDTLSSLVLNLAGASAAPLVDSVVSDVYYVAGPTNPQYKFKAGQELPSPTLNPGTSYADAYPQLYLDDSEFERSNDNVMRPFDVLLPMVVGPWQDPTMPSTVSDRDDWTTFGEMIAMSSGMDSSTEGQRLYFASNAGQLWFDQFIEHDDNVTLNGLPDPNEPVFGPGTTFAMRLVDAVICDDALSGDLATPVLGQVNINTATRRVLSVLPGLSPTTITGAWWWAGLGKLEPTSDVAATVSAYRDRGVVLARDGFTHIDFSNGRAVPGNNNFPTAIPGIRETPGFTSTGEILGARAVGFDLHSIDVLGVDQQSSDRQGVSTVRYSSTPATPTYDLDDEIDDDYAESLEIANGVANTITTRSDLFACWFVVHGYTREDCTGLKNTDPMIPSIARRYLMVVDRSNVTALGQEPRIILFKEVPLTQ